MTIDPQSTKLYAPQARLVDLRSGAVLGATKVTADGPTVLAPDILSAKVTLPNTGIAQLHVTLNNQRFGAGSPISPPWKYNDFSRPLRNAQPSTDGLGAIAFGSLVRLDLRYGDSRWVKMIIAQVNDLQFTFPAAGGAQLHVVGEDLLCRAKVKPNADKTYERKQEEDIAREVWDTVFSQPQSRPTFSTLEGAREQEGRNQPLRSLRHQKTTTYFQFLQTLADRLDYELFMQFRDELVDAGAGPTQAATASTNPSQPAISLSQELEFWFQPARSKYPPQGEVQDGLDPGTSADAPPFVTYELRWGRNLIEFTPKMKMFEMPSAAEATGTNHGSRQRQRQQLTAGEIDDLLSAELPESPAYAGVERVTALAARAQYFADAGPGAESTESGSASNLDAPRLKIKAGARFMKKVREFMTADGQVIGLPRLRAGNYVHIVGLRPPFDGYYYVTKTVHTLDASGYRTQFSVRRPGMLPPDQYLPAATSAGAQPGAPA